MNELIVLKLQFEQTVTRIAEIQEEIQQLYLEKQRLHDQYFDLYKTLDPASIPDGLTPSLYPPKEVIGE
jgi:hypothetical protein